MTFHRTDNKSNSVGVTGGAEMAYPFGEYKINPLFRGVRGTPSFVFRVIFCRAVYAILSFVCPSYNYSFRLPLWYLQSLLDYFIYISIHYNLTI